MRDLATYEAEASTALKLRSRLIRMHYKVKKAGKFLEGQKESNRE